MQNKKKNMSSKEIMSYLEKEKKHSQDKQMKAKTQNKKITPMGQNKMSFGTSVKIFFQKNFHTKKTSVVMSENQHKKLEKEFKKERKAYNKNHK